VPFTNPDAAEPEANAPTVNPRFLINSLPQKLAVPKFL